MYTKQIFDNVFLFVSLTLPSLVMFFLFSVLLSSPTKMSCGENIGPRTISSLEDSNQTEWNVCIDPAQVEIPYPDSGPNICVEKQFKAFSPLGSNGFCVANYKYSLPATVDDFWETGYRKLKGQVINGSAEHMPSYSANMPNVWHIYVVNFLNYDEAKEVWSYKATEEFNKNVWFSILIFTFTYSLLLFWIYRKIINNYLALISLIGFPITFVIPFFATLAHENHFALGLLFSYLLLNLNLFNSKFTKLFHILLFVISLSLALNISRLYLWPMWIESQNPILHVFGTNLLSLITIPNIYQISLITSFAAREVFVGSLATIYAVQDDGATKTRLIQRLKRDKNSKGEKIIASKGAPEALIEVSNLSEKDKKQIIVAMETMAAEGYRVLGIGVTDFSGKDFPKIWRLAIKRLALINCFPRR
jgi:hypothetical protein